jgi:hypothetical protein
MSLSNPPRWRTLAAFGFLNFLTGILLLRYFTTSSVLVKGFGTVLFLLGISLGGWLISSHLLWRRDLVGLSLLKILAIVNAVLYLILRTLLVSDFGSVYRSAFSLSSNPGALANQWSVSIGLLTLMCIAYASTTAYLFFRFRQPLIISISQVGLPVRSALVPFLPFYQGPRRWLFLTIWSFCAPSFLSVIGVLGIYGLAGLMYLLDTTAGSPGRLFYYLSLFVWWLSIPSALLATLGAPALALISDVPSRTKWRAFALVAAAWTSTGVAYLLFTKM